MASCHVLSDVADQTPLKASLAGIWFWGPMMAKPPAPILEGSRDRLLQGRLIAGSETGDPAVVARPEAALDNRAGGAPLGGLSDDQAPPPAQPLSASLGPPGLIEDVPPLVVQNAQMRGQDRVRRRF